MEKINKNYWAWLLLISSIFIGQIYRYGFKDFISYLMLGVVILSIYFIYFRLLVAIM